MTLVEVLIALFILSIALLAMASVGTTSLISLRIARDREHATNGASAAVEAARARDFADLALAATDDPSSLPAEIQTLLDIESATCAGGEAIVQDAASSDPVPLVQQVGTNGAHDVYTLVTWGEQDCTATHGAVKRVVTLATWRDQGQLRSVRNETLVAPAGRGLPVPNFDVKPVESGLSFTSTQAADKLVKCIPHQLRNLGASDSYEWELIDVVGLGSGGPIKSTSSSWKTPNGKWEVTAYFEQPPVDPPRGWAKPPDSALMTDNDGNELPESDEVVVNGDRATITVCYQPSEETADFTTTIEVVSRFDERRTETLHHTVSIAPPTTWFHLQDRDDTGAHPRDADDRSTHTSYPPLVMAELSDGNTEDRLQLLGDQLFDWSTEIGSPSASGMRLLRESSTTALRSVEWRHQFPAAITLLPNAEVTLYVAPDSALAGDTEVFEEGGTVRMDLKVELTGLNEKENSQNVIWGPVTAQISYDHAGTDWAQRVVSLPFATGRDFASGERLRVRVTCQSTSGEHCNVGYDASTHPAHLKVDLQ